MAQTGVQLLTGFLLTIPFTPRFEELPESRHALYAVVLSTAIVSTILLMTPVALHRALFRQGERPWLVAAADLFARLGLAAMAVAVVGVTWFILDVVAGVGVATLVAGVIAVFVVAVWVLVPWRERRRTRRARGS
ncbi:MAG: sodium:proton antiporter [Aeromicrobium sp.]|nr:sodium:proton antiporter [Aeromicrobium sp.]